MKVIITIEVPEGAAVVVDGPAPRPAIVQAAQAAGLIDDMPWPDEVAEVTPIAARPSCPRHGPDHVKASKFGKGSYCGAKENDPRFANPKGYCTWQSAA